MFTRETGNAISKIKDPYGRLTVIAVIVLCSAVTTLFYLIRDERTQKLLDNKIEIQQLKNDIAYERHIVDSQSVIIEDLRIDTAMIRAKFTIQLYTQNDKFNKILNSIKSKLVNK